MELFVMNSLSAESRLALVQFLKENSILKVLDLRVLEGISPIFSETEYGPGQVIFQPGDPADAVFIIRAGSVEVSQGDPPKAVAYLAVGECFGEMSLLNDTPRSSTIRVPETATIIRIPKAAINELRKRFPEMTTTLAEVVNRRAAGTMPFQAAGLQGNLAFFDLATVIQTVVSSRQSGLLIFFGRSGKAAAQLTMKDGAIVHARFKHLTGETAVFELITRTAPLDFIFERRQVDDTTPDEKLRRRPPHMLLMEGARRSDELPKLMKSLGWPDAAIVQTAEVASWQKLCDDSEAIGPHAWPLLTAKCTVRELTEKLPFDRYSILTLLDALVNKGHAKKTISEQTTARLEQTKVLPNAGVADKPKGLSGPAVSGAGGSMLRTTHGTVSVFGGSSPFLETLKSFNGVTTNMAAVLGKSEVRSILTQALKKAATFNPNLAHLSVNSETATLEVGAISPEFIASKDSSRALEHLLRTFLEVAVASRRG